MMHSKCGEDLANWLGVRHTGEEARLERPMDWQTNTLHV
jgi:hypothetical protein